MSGGRETNCPKYLKNKNLGIVSSFPCFLTKRGDGNERLSTSVALNPGGPFASGGVVPAEAAKGVPTLISTDTLYG